jgi:hypothetical protein
MSDAYTDRLALDLVSRVNPEYEFDRARTHIVRTGTLLFCSRKQDRSCVTHYVQIEDAVERHYEGIRFTQQFAIAVRGKLRETLDDRTTAAKLFRDDIAEHWPSSIAKKTTCSISRAIPRT